MENLAYNGPWGFVDFPFTHTKTKRKQQEAQKTRAASMDRRLLFFFLFFALLRSGAESEPVQNADEIGHGSGGVVWAVQVSDLHISSFYPERARDLPALLAPFLAFVNPSLVLITGDLTDAKSKDRLQMRQEEAEWVDYKEAMRHVVQQSGIPLHAFFDIRGNHDKFGVPEAGGHLDYFSKYSISAMKNQTAPVQSITVLKYGRKHLFVGLDDAMSVGLRGPCNLFGHPTDSQLEELDQQLSQSDPVTKIVFGHFPITFTARSKSGRSLEAILAKHSVSAYLCGHLHTHFGTNLFKHHWQSDFRKREVFHFPRGSDGNRVPKPYEFWEWEAGDWRTCRIVRIIAVDGGHTSFIDIDLRSFSTPFPPLILPTYPLDSTSMQRVSQQGFPSVYQNTIRTLVFSLQPLLSVSAKIFDSKQGSHALVEELRMECSSSKPGDEAQLFTASWNSTKYSDSSPTRYLLQIVATDSSGISSTSPLRPFSSDGKIGPLLWTWRTFFVMGTLWDALYPLLLLLGFTILFALLLIPKIGFIVLKKKGWYNKDNHFNVKNMLKKSCMSKVGTYTMLALAYGCRYHPLYWLGQVLIVIYTMFFPWFWGQPLGQGHPEGTMSIWGWNLQGTKPEYSHTGLGLPDVMVIVLPYLSKVLIPLVALIFALAAETSLVDATHPPPTSSKSTSHCKSCFLCQRWIRKALLLACSIVTFIHVKQVTAIVGAYGLKAMLLSPGFAWPPPLLLAVAFQLSSRQQRGV